MKIKFERRDIIFRNADFVVGGQTRQSIRSNFIDSEAYFQDDLTWCVQKAKLRPKWKQFLLTFDMHGVLCIFGAAIPATLIFYLSSGYERRAMDIWTAAFLIIQAISGTSSTYHPKRSSGRIFYLLLLHLGFFCISLIVSYLITIITNPNYEHQISSFEEIRAANFRLAAEEETKNYLIESNTVNNDWGHIRPFNCVPFVFFFIS